MKQEPPTEHPPNPDIIIISPSKRLKTQISDSPSTSLSSKGKSKIIIKQENTDSDKDTDNDLLEQQEMETCGVCLSEEGVFLRGFIDSCDHYFCFVCIMEWAKVESRCPICKRRFSAIRRACKEGVFVNERIVNVPVRDQIYYLDGNATIGPRDPYSETKCTVCNGSYNEDVLLLCDLCDTAAHSYCVSLDSVPEGDWFCKDCTLLKDEHDKVESNTTSENGNICPSRSVSAQFTPSDVSIFDIVRDSRTRESDVEQREPVLEQSNTQSTVERSNAPNARTLQRCLKVHSRIRVLRENWDGFRGGSLNFSSTFEDRNKTSQNQSSSSNHESTSQNEPYDTDKAWKMMHIATKALGKKSGNKKTVTKSSEVNKKTERLLNEASKVKPNSNLLFGGLKKNESELSSCKKIIAYAQVRNNHYNRQNVCGASNFAGSSYQPLSIATDKRFAQNESESSASRKIIASAQVKNNRHNCQNLSAATNVVGSSNQSVFIATDKRCAKNGSEHSSSTKNIASAHMKNNHHNCHKLSAATKVVGSSDRSSSIATDKRCAEKLIIASLEKKEKLKKETQSDGNIKEIEDAKSEIQSLVKINLKLLSRDKKLEVDAFKEVARHATHSIMAACGFEPPKARFRSFEKVVCGHSQTQKRPSSTLMPTSCRECFFSFVKNAVSTIAFDRTTSCKE